MVTRQVPVVATVPGDPSLGAEPAQAAKMGEPGCQPPPAPKAVLGLTDNPFRPVSLVGMLWGRLGGAPGRQVC